MEFILVLTFIVGFVILVGIIYYFMRYFKTFGRYVAVNAGAGRVSSAIRGTGEVGRALREVR